MPPYSAQPSILRAEVGGQSFVLQIDCGDNARAPQNRPAHERERVVDYVRLPNRVLKTPVRMKSSWIAQRTDTIEPPPKERGCWDVCRHYLGRIGNVPEL